MKLAEQPAAVTAALSASCRLCGYERQQIFLTLSGMPRWNHRLLRAEEKVQDCGLDLQVLQCEACGFVSLPLYLDDNYYEDYVLVPSRSAQAQAFQVGQAHEFVSRFELQGRRVLEVGCGDGFFLGALCDAGAQAVGIEPSREQCTIARARGLTVEQGLLTLGRRLPQAPFEGFASRQVFEHVEDMRGFLLAIRDNLASRAVGLVEVPNLDTLVAHSRFFDFIPEHINYFTPRTLSTALSLAGFEVLDIVPVDQGESLRAIVSWTAPFEGSRVQDGIGQLRTQFADFVCACRSRQERVAVWGAGGKGLSIMASVDLSEIEVVVDADPAKVGRWTPVSHREVFPPSELNLRGIDAIIITAPAYQFEIARRLRYELNFSGVIALAGTKFQLFEEECWHDSDIR